MPLTGVIGSGLSGDVSPERPKARTGTGKPSMCTPDDSYTRRFMRIIFFSRIWFWPDPMFVFSGIGLMVGTKRRPTSNKHTNKHTNTNGNPVRNNNSNADGYKIYFCFAHTYCYCYKNANTNSI